MDGLEPPSFRKPFLQRFGWAIFFAIICVFVALSFGTNIDTKLISITYVAPKDGWRQAGGTIFFGAALATFTAIVVREIAERSSMRREVAAHEHFQAQARAITEASTRAVARNLWGEDHATEVFEEIVATNFSSHILRENYIHGYTFEPISKARDVVRLRCWISYATFNPAKKPELFEPVFAADDTSKLYPNHKHIRPPVLMAAKIGERVFTEEEIAGLNRDIHTNASKFSLKSAAVPLGSYKIQPGGRIEVRLMFESVEPIDNKWIQIVGVPTKGLTVVIHNRVGPEFSIFVAPLFRSDFSPQENLTADGSDWERRYEGVILPHSGWTTRWNRTPIPGPPRRKRT